LAPLAEIWLRSPVFRDLWDRALLKGACGTCENRFICGGCRGKAYGLTGDYPACYLAAAG
jgi:radical SAM protein with 4Fe4S-binding SPASM domain